MSLPMRPPRHSTFDDGTFRALIESISDVVAVLRPDGHVLYVSPSVEPVGGYRPGELVGTNWFDLLHPESRQEALRALQAMQMDPAQTARTVLRCRHRDGRWLTVESTARDCRQDASVGGFVVTLRDVTARTAAEQALREEQRQRGTLIENLPGVAYRCRNDRQWTPEYVSANILDLTGFDASQFIEGFQTFGSLIHPDDREPVWRQVQEAVAARRQFRLEYRIVTASGAIKWAWGQGCGVFCEDGELIALEGFLQDVTERMEQREKLQRLTRTREMASAVNALVVRARSQAELCQDAVRIAVVHGGLAGASIALGSDGKQVPVARYDLGWAGDGQVLEGSSMSLPLAGAGGVAGVLELRAAEKDFFGEPEVEVLQELAANLSYALDHITKEQRLDYLSIYDPLTRLPNRHLFLRRLGGYLASAREKGAPLTVAMFDIAQFKSLNDTVGRAAADSVLVALGDRIKAAAGGPSFAGRMSGDKFAVVLPDADSDRAALRLAEGAWARVTAPLEVAGQLRHLALWTGTATAPPDGGDAETLLANAELALKQAKSRRDPLVRYRPELRASVERRLRLQELLRGALERQELALQYQPKVDVRTGAIAGAEALLRWTPPELGLVSPSEFVPLLEESGLIDRVGAWVLLQAVRDRRAWLAAGLAAPPVAVNVSPLQLQRPDFVASVRRILDGAAGIDLEVTETGLDLEITEAGVRDDIDDVGRKLAALRDMGMRIAIDDFGTGYSSLSVLPRLPIHALKIDRSFVAGMTESPDSLAIISAVLALARSMHLRVVAEGVETAEQLKLLRLLNCDEYQGFLFSGPLSGEAFAALLREKTARR